MKANSVLRLQTATTEIRLIHIECSGYGALNGSLSRRILLVVRFGCNRSNHSKIGLFLWLEERRRVPLKFCQILLAKKTNRKFGYLFHYLLFTLSKKILTKKEIRLLSNHLQSVCREFCSNKATNTVDRLNLIRITPQMHFTSTVKRTFE